MSRGKMERTLDVLSSLNNSPLERNFKSAIARRTHINDGELKQIIKHLVSRGYVAAHRVTPKNNGNYAVKSAMRPILFYVLTPVGQHALTWITSLELTA